MEREELKKIIDSTLNSDCKIELNVDNEYYVYTDFWYIDFGQLKKIDCKVKIQSIVIDGGKIMLVIK